MRSRPARSTRREKFALAALLLGAASLYLAGLGQSGWGNAYYAAAAQAGSVDWTAFLFGSSDAGNAITVDKPPASLWLMALSGRLFGVSPASMLLPEAFLGVATVAVTYALVRRHHSARTALLAGGILAVTPAAALIFRYDNPDALLVLLVTIGLYATVRALDDHRIRWTLLIGLAFGLAFLTKQLQAFIVLPVVLAVYLWAGNGGLRERMRGVGIAMTAAVVSAGWWVALVTLVPSGRRPWIGGTSDDSFLGLTLGYNGLGRIFGGQGNNSPSGAGIDRLLIGNAGWLIGWLIPAALALTVAAQIWQRKAPRTDPARATLILLGGSMVTTLTALSAMSGIFHAYYSVAAAPSIAGCVAIGASVLWRERAHSSRRLTLAATVAGSGIWGCALLASDGGPLAAQVLVIIAAVIGAALICVAPTTRWGSSTAAVLAITAVMAGPVTASVAIASVGHAGSGAAAVSPHSADGSSTFGLDPRVVDALAQNGRDFRWVAATIGSPRAARYQLASGYPVMAIGGFKSTDPSPTLDQFQLYVTSGQVHWFIASGHGAIRSWVEQNFAPQQKSGITMYDLTTPPSPQPAAAHTSTMSELVDTNPVLGLYAARRGDDRTAY
ncbi:ArnT family glycosyltransferase [Microbacterium trichothecenolyticum]|uniref:Undecaprenyl phosphate-alpha-4-amino-4-deoxy-L-arabinose arabinosyl transferase n=1 Tax=Microbacterium trichothecenolyticum TaxID=69370 RepID=A0A0M2HHK8_MICTR|nr:glycosyltransferase family 39 protein [Microbacterium trichothecenolyticum]KJL43786.1 Undecaprenyl phosphate-alpha-4-amino-4-deoxy-L-arabinose arabinosyl transferase [Microbacterium trichothecenolyticum]